MIRRKPGGESQRNAWVIASAMLRYPDQQLLTALPVIRGELEDSKLPDRARLIALIDQWLGEDPYLLQQRYVATFDHNKNRALHVSWFQYGDRRQRGMVLLKLKRRYMDFEMAPREDELPDWLPLMLEFAAHAPDPEGVSLLQEWRAAIELIRRSLTDEDSEYAPILDMISGTLPKLGSNLREAVDKLLEEGPPGEEIGLEPFGPDSNLESQLPPAAAIEYPAAFQGVNQGETR